MLGLKGQSCLIYMYMCLKLKGHKGQISSLYPTLSTAITLLSLQHLSQDAPITGRLLL